MLKKIVISVFLYSLFLGGCSSTGDIRTEPVVEDLSAPGNGSATGDNSASTSAMPGGVEYRGDPLDNPASPLSTRTIYFDFDSSEIEPEYQENILAHGTYLAEHSDASLVLEGHTDEKGTREYNIGLGERRAQAVRRLLLFQGAVDKQIQVVSYGEEKPAADGHDEMSYEQNRRVEIIYQR